MNWCSVLPHIQLHGRVTTCAGAGGAAGAGALQLQTRAGEGMRPASLASLLRASPQAVPFDRRVDLFRAVLALDKAQGRWDRPTHDPLAQPPIKVGVAGRGAGRREGEERVRPG